MVSAARCRVRCTVRSPWGSGILSGTAHRFARDEGLPQPSAAPGGAGKALAVGGFGAGLALKVLE